MNPAINTLFHEVERLDNRSLDTFIGQVMSLRTQRDVTNRQKNEAGLLQKIIKSLPFEEIERLHILNKKRVESNISEKEYNELVVIVEKTEKLSVSRLKHLTSLARLRNIPVRELVKQLGING